MQNGLGRVGGNGGHLNILGLTHLASSLWGSPGSFIPCCFGFSGGLAAMFTVGLFVFPVRVYLAFRLLRFGFPWFSHVFPSVREP